MKHIFLINPNSGKNKKNNIVNKIEKVCQNRKLNYEIFVSKYPGDIAEFVNQYPDASVVFYAVGGDGTINEVLNAMIDKKRAYLSVIPMGSGNDFNRSLKRIKEKEFSCDVGMINDRYFMNIASIGLDADTGSNARIMKKYRMPRSQIYYLSLVYTLFGFHPRTLTLNIDGYEIREKISMVAICNGSLYGGGFNISPHSKLDDGYMDVLVVAKTNRLSVLLAFLMILLRKKSKNIRTFKAKTLTIKYKKPVYACFDGELEINDYYEFGLLNKKIKIYNDKELIYDIIKK